MQVLERADIKIYRDPNAWGEINHLDPITPELCDGLENMVTISIFTERKDEDFSKGWFGESILGFTPGSRLRALQKQKLVPSLLVQIERAINESLEWMLDEGIATDISTTVTRSKKNKNKLYFSIKVERGIESDVNFLYQYNWKNQPSIVR